MSTIREMTHQYQFNRRRTLAILEKVEQCRDPQAVLAWRPGPGRAHVGWQLMHIAMTEELFATTRLGNGRQPQFADLVARFRGGSTPDEDVPKLVEIRQLLDQTRQHLLATLGTWSDDRLSEIPAGWKEREYTLHEILHLISWHEAHHQGQAHLTLNLYRAHLQD